MRVDQLAEARRVVAAQRLGVAKGLEHRVRVHEQPASDTVPVGSPVLLTVCTPAISARKRKTCFEFSVLPEPLSPDVTMVCEVWFMQSDL